MAKLKRKPVPSQTLQVNEKSKVFPPSEPNSSTEAAKQDPQDLDLVESPVQDEPIEEGESRPDLDKQLRDLQLETEPEQPPPAYTEDALVEEPSTIDEETQATSPGQESSSKWKATLGEVRHFAGGLIAHPYEATKHYSVLRHSHGLVFYQGPTTSVAITVFSDQPLPPDRRLWLQKRGFSGRAGLKIGSTLGTRSAWIDVTPAIDATADMLPQADERAWQRDINKFLKKAKDAKHIRNQKPYETDIVRIPHIAEDGYFRVVLCAGRRVLCPSPVFRFASSSLDPSHLRGASLSTLPLEVGVKIGALAARHGANYAAHGALQPATNAYQNTIQPVVQKVNPLGLTQVAAHAAYDVELARVNEQYDEKQNKTYRLASTDTVESCDVVGADDGPRAPFPIKFSGIVSRGCGKSRQQLGIPTANLTGVPAETLLRMNGVYFGWTTIARTKVSKDKSVPDDVYDMWYPALIFASPIRNQQAKVIEERFISAYLIHDFEQAVFFDAGLNVMVTAFLRPNTPSISGANTDVEKGQMQIGKDIAIAQASLNRPAWSAEATLERIKADASGRSFTERVADARSLGQKQIDKVPLHRLGVRTGSMGFKDRLIGNGGICVKR